MFIKIKDDLQSNGRQPDIGFLELFEDILGLKLHLLEDFRPRKSSKRCKFRSLKLTFFEEFFVFSFVFDLIALSYSMVLILVVFNDMSL
jgi:hypothetical protein